MAVTPCRTVSTLQSFDKTLVFVSKIYFFIFEIGIMIIHRKEIYLHDATAIPCQSAALYFFGDNNLLMRLSIGFHPDYESGLHHLLMIIMFRI